MLNQIFTNISEEVLERMKDSTPEDKQRMSKIAAEFTNMTMQLLKESPEFRDAFARIHAELFNYPESEIVIRHAIKAYGEFTPQTTH